MLNGHAPSCSYDCKRPIQVENFSIHEALEWKGRLEKSCCVGKGRRLYFRALKLLGKLLTRLFDEAATYTGSACIGPEIDSAVLKPWKVRLCVESTVSNPPKPTLKIS